MVGKIYVKNANIQFWGSPTNPTPVGIAFSIDCCPCGCWEYNDDFNYANTTTPPNFYEAQGDWGVSGFNLVEDYSTGVDGTLGAVIVCTAEQPSYSAGMQRLSVDVIPEDGDVYYLWLCVPTDTSEAGGFEVKFECTTAPSQWTVSIGSESVSYTGVTATPLGFVKIGACVDNDSGMAKASIAQSAEEGLWVDTATPGSGRFSALGHDNDSHLNVFDNYIVGELRDAVGNECDDCFCRCLGDAMPKQLTATIVLTSGTAACGEGETGTLTWEWNAGTSRWKGDIVVTDGASSHTFSWCLTCESANDNDPLNPGKNFALSLCGPDGCASAWPSGYLTVFRPTAASRCQPDLLLRFGPMVLPTIDTMCFMCPSLLPGSGGEFYVDITL